MSICERRKYKVHGTKQLMDTEWVKGAHSLLTFNFRDSDMKKLH